MAYNPNPNRGNTRLKKTQRKHASVLTA